MRPEWQKYLSRQVPRYTSYPSALFFREMDGVSLADALEQVSPYEPVSIYVHVPFCARLCWYCGCNMRVENAYQRALPYVDQLLAEIRMVADLLGGRGVTTQVHFGGGTPNFLHPDELARILDAVEVAFGLTDGTTIAMELDPRLATPARLGDLARLGVSRMSLGVQDFDPAVQAAINRIQPYDMIEMAVSAMREAGVEDISFDLLYGLPLQTVSGFAGTIGKTLALAPDRISLFGYAHLPAKLRHQRLIDEQSLPSRDRRAALAALGAAQFAAAGYRRIGFDHFALPHTAIARAACNGRLNRNFQGFTEDPARTVIGLGASAISSLKGVLAQNDKDIAGYGRAIDAGRLATIRGLVATPAQQAVGEWIHGLLCRQQASLSAWRNAVSPTGDLSPVLDRLQPFLADGVVCLDGDILRICPGADVLARAVAALFDPAVEHTPSAMSPAV